MKIALSILLVACSLLFGGCATYRNMDRQENCTKSIKDYNKMIRWQEAEKAAIAFVDAAQRPEFDATAETLRRRNVSIADYRILAHQCSAEHKKAEATVEFDYFILPDNRLKTLTDHQRWVFREKNEADPDLIEGWKLTTPLPSFK